MDNERLTLIPEQLFNTQDDFIAHVKRYAVENRFNVRLDDVERDKAGRIRKRDIVCSAEGAPRGYNKREASNASGRQSSSEPSPAGDVRGGGVAHSGAHRRRSMKTGCKWLARASRQPSGVWKMIMLRLEHNHPVTATFELTAPTPLMHNIRTGDESSISAAAAAAQEAASGGDYRVPSVQFKDLFLQMSAACADLCWSAAQHPDTIQEVLSEIRRLNTYLNRQPDYIPTVAAAAAAVSNSSNVRSLSSGLPTIPEPHSSSSSNSASSAMDVVGATVTDNANGTLVAMNHSAPPPTHLVTITESPELSTAEAAAPVAAQATTNGRGGGPTKRTRGRPRKNPLASASSKSKSKPQQKQTVESPPAQTPTPAVLASLSHQIISQNQVSAAPTSNVQRSINSSLTLPPQTMQINNSQQHAARMTMMTAAPPVLDARSHVTPLSQRQQQQPVPQPQQSPTFFLSAAEGVGKSTTTATGNLGRSTAKISVTTSTAAATEVLGICYPTGKHCYTQEPGTASSIHSGNRSRECSTTTTAAWSATSLSQSFPAATAATATGGFATTTNAHSITEPVRSRCLPSSTAAAICAATTAAISVPSPTVCSVPFVTTYAPILSF